MAGRGAPARRPKPSSSVHTVAARGGGGRYAATGPAWASGAWSESSWGASGSAGPANKRRRVTTSGEPWSGSGPSSSSGQGQHVMDRQEMRRLNISKQLAGVLRHNAQELGLTIRPDGFCLLDEVVRVQSLRQLRCTAKDIIEETQTNDKKRFEVKMIEGKEMVRAVQGHSMKSVKDEDLLTPLPKNAKQLPDYCVHGTYWEYYESILEHGLIAGGAGDWGPRNHIHFIPRDIEDGQVISGMRYNCEVVFYLNLRAALEADVPFFISKNEVILSPGIEGTISPEFILAARDLGTGEYVFGGDEAQKADKESKKALWYSSP